MIKKAIVLAFATMAIGAGPAAAATSGGLPAGTCGSSEGCGCGGVFVLKYKFILAHC
jgi:hypothetical protein